MQTERLQANLIENGDGVTLSIPLTITLSLGAPQSTAAAPSEAGPPAPPDESLQERVRIDRDYTGRLGYDDEFLGRGGLRVPLPRLDAGLEARVSRLLHLSEVEGAAAYTLHYEHFSVIQHRERKMALLTAVNVDGARRFNLGEREGDAWSKDPRIEQSHQIGSELYEGTELDRGHLVRRLDPVWGATPVEASRANDDTFHFTNCAPQHARFNRGKRLWQGIENFVLNQALAAGFRLCVLTGPVFKPRDPEFREIRLPLQYWKIMVFARADGSLSASAYLLSQAELVQDMLREAARQPAFDPGLFQVPIARVTAETGIDFSYLSAHDPLEAVGGEREVAVPGETSGPLERPITRLQDLML